MHVANAMHLLCVWICGLQLLYAYVNTSSVVCISHDTAVLCVHDFYRGSWLLVRRVKRGTTWHPATLNIHPLVIETHLRRDNLAGQSSYGTYVLNETADSTFSIAYSNLLKSSAEILLMTGDRSNYMVTTLGSIVPGTRVLNVTYSSSTIGLSYRDNTL